MLSRRDYLALSAACLIFPAHSRSGTPNSFENTLAQVVAQPELMDNVHGDREGLATEFTARQVGPRFAPSPIQVAQEAIDLIIACEVTGAQRYTAKYQQPTWPNGQSGVTIGIGYDLGYVKPEWLDDDWGSILTQTQINRLGQVCAKNGPPAKTFLPELQDININWDSAYQQFMTTSLPRFTAETLAVLKNAGDLNTHSPKCFGAIVSLVYNRGPSFNLLDDRHAEMRNIKLHMVRKDYSLIPAEIYGMRKLWPQDDPKVAGLYWRRTLEAQLFEKGLQEMKS